MAGTNCTCVLWDCDKPHYGYGLCNMHYQRLRKTGTTEQKVKKPSFCNVDGCDNELKPPHGRGMCTKHYTKWRRHGDPLYEAPRYKYDRTCSIDGCDEEFFARGWCARHYTRWSRYGDPEHRFPWEIQNGRRVCSGCGEDKPLDEWTRSHCKECAALKTREYRVVNPKPTIGPKDFTCKVCGDSYSADPRQSRYCSPQCADIAKNNWSVERRHRLRSIRIEHFYKTEIFERDKWVCHICERPIPRDAKYPDPLSPSLDHVIPVSRGGEHSRANTAASHLRCNLSKGDRMAA